MINVQNVSKYYGDFKAVDDVSFNVDKGEIVAFLGPNGAGKTTTMRIITGFMAPTKGNILINDVDIFDEPDVVKATIGYLPEHPPLYPELTVNEYLTFVAELKKVAKDKIKKLLIDNFDMSPKGIINYLKLRRPIYKKTACYGHFGREEDTVTW